MSYTVENAKKTYSEHNSQIPHGLMALIEGKIDAAARRGDSYLILDNVEVEDFPIRGTWGTMFDAIRHEFTKRGFKVAVGKYSVTFKGWA